MTVDEALKAVKQHSLSSDSIGFILAADTLVGEVERLHLRVTELETEVSTPVLVATNRLADSLADSRAEVERLREECSDWEIKIHDLHESLVEERNDVEHLRSVNARLVEALDNIMDYANEYYENYCDWWGDRRLDQQQAIKTNVEIAVAALAEAKEAAK